MPWLSFSTGSSVTRLCSSGRSSQIAESRKPMAVEPAEHAVMVRAPGQNALLLAGDRLEHRPGAAAELDAIAAHEAARQVGVVELLAPQAGRRRAVAVGRLLHDSRRSARRDGTSGSCRRGPTELASPFGKAAGRRIQQQPRRADAVAGDDDDFAPAGTARRRPYRNRRRPRPCRARWSVISRTRQCVRSSTPARIACGQ